MAHYSFATTSHDLRFEQRRRRIVMIAVDGSVLTDQSGSEYLGAVQRVAPFALGLLTSLTSAPKFNTAPQSWPNLPTLAN
jgi:hypothetical protein